MITINELKPGCIFYMYGTKYHFVGLASYDETVVVYWCWNKWKRRRAYIAQPLWAFEISAEGITKTKRRLRKSHKH